MVDLHRLRILRALIAAGSVNGAAAALQYTPSAISQHIAALQRETGLVLVERVGRGVVPTPAAHTLAAAGDDVFDRVAELDRVVADLRDARRTRCSVRYFASAGGAWIPPIIADVVRTHPEVSLDLILDELHPLAPGEPGPDIDITVTTAMDQPTGHPGDPYDVHPLLVDPYVAVVHRDSPLAQRESIRVAELAEVVLVDNDAARGPCRQGLLNACTAAGFTPEFAIETHDYASGMSVVAEGVGVTIVPRLGLVNVPEAVVAVELTDPTPERHIIVRIRRSSRDNPVVTRILALLRARVAVSAVAVTQN